MGNNQSSSSSSGGSKLSSSSNPLRSRSNTADSTTQRVTVDGGFLEPQSLLYSHIDYSRPTVSKLIVDRKLSPFYLGLLDFEDDWDGDALVRALGEAEQQATQTLKDAHAAATEAAADADAQQLNVPPGTRKHKEAVLAYNQALLHRERLAEMLKIREKRGGGGLQWTSKTEQAKLYQGRALECPICFLYYPPNMVHTRCCDQPICTECFVQIKRAEPTPTHLESEPAACPFCMETNFGCVYAGASPVRPGQDGASAAGSAPKPRRKSFAHTEKEVVTTDMIHPDWEQKLETMKATVARRANRRIVFRQVGDRLIPVGITSGRSGDGSNPTMATTTLPPNFLSQIAAALDASNENGGSSGGRRRGSRSSRRRGGGDEVAALLESLGLGGGVDLEEMMLQEAMRLSQVEEEERQKKAKEEEAKKAAQSGSAAGAGASTSPPPSAAAADRSPRTTERLLSEAISDESALSTSPSSPPASSFANRGSPALGALAAGGLAATTVSPSSSSSFPQPGESASGSSLGRGIVGAGLAAASTSRVGSGSAPSSSTSAPPSAVPQLAAVSPIPKISLDLPSTPIDASPATPTAPAPTAIPSTFSASATPASNLAASSSTSPLASSSASLSSSIAVSPSPSAGYQPLPDESDADAASLASGKHSTAQFENGGAETGRLVDL
ncbi:hypothetical protein JCM8547_004547 [Rhodosporidiobolus lusitaniae]